jgi:short subunit dehydrogenase-like uncharacterized protein
MILVAGATGFTGKLISRELCKMGLRPVLAGRNQAKLAALVEEIRGAVSSQRGHTAPNGALSSVVMDVTDPASISRALSEVSVVINCAGPFTDLGEPVIKEAVRRGIHYLDTTGEQPFIRMAFEKYGSQAKSTGSIVMPACAFEYALGDAAAALAAESIEPCEKIELTYAIEGFGSSRGTKKSILRVLSESGYQRRGGAAFETRLARDHRKVDIAGRRALDAYSFPAGEVFMAPLHTSVDNISTFMVMPARRIVLRLAPSLGAMLRWGPIARFAANRVDRSQFGPTPAERQNTRFTIKCHATSTLGRRTVTVEGADPYGLTAQIAARVASLIDSGNVRLAGPLSPSMASGPQTIVDLTTEAGASWSVSSSR